MVKEIEEVRPELQMNFFGAQREVLGNGKIVVGQARTVVLIAPGSPKAACRRMRGKLRFIKGGVRIPVVLVQRSCPDNVGPVIKLVEAAEVVGTVEHSKWCAALYGRNAGDLPIAEHLPVHAVIPAQQAMSRSDW
jgi:hypothetical protein